MPAANVKPRPPLRHLNSRHQTEVREEEKDESQPGSPERHRALDRALIKGILERKARKGQRTASERG